MATVNYTSGNMSPKQEEQLPDIDYVFAVRLPREEGSTEVNVTVLAKSALKVESITLGPGSTVPQLSATKLIELTMPDKTVRYCTNGGGKWFWTGLVATND